MSCHGRAHPAGWNTCAMQQMLPHGGTVAVHADRDMEDVIPRR
jgi:hypothetical protein